MKGVITQKRIIMRSEKALLRYLLDIKKALQHFFYNNIPKKIFFLTYFIRLKGGGGSHATVFNDYII